MSTVTKTKVTNLDAKPCHRCNGARTYTVMEPKWWGGSKSGVALTGHLVSKCYVCEACNGTGKAGRS